MIEDKKEFPNDLKKKIISKVNKKIKIIFYDGADIKNDIFNLSILEPCKIIFNHDKNNIVVYVIEKEVNVYEYFIGSVKKQNKSTVTNLIGFVNNSL